MFEATMLLILTFLPVVIAGALVGIAHQKDQVLAEVLASR